MCLTTAMPYKVIFCSSHTCHIQMVMEKNSWRTFYSAQKPTLITTSIYALITIFYNNNKNVVFVVPILLRHTLAPLCARSFAFTSGYFTGQHFLQCNVAHFNTNDSYFSALFAHFALLLHIHDNN